jgi:cytochrome c assembly protein
MFDIENALQSWRTSLPLELQSRADQLDELEQHLRDAFDDLTAHGEPPDAAWSAALASLGPTPSLAREFRKLDRAARIWPPAWIALAATALVLVLTILVIGPRARTGALIATHVILITTGYCALLALGLLSATAALARAFAGWDDTHHHSLRRTGVLLATACALATAPGILLGAAWSHTHLGRWWAWDPKEIGGLAVLTWSLLLCKTFSSRSTPPQLLILLGLLANPVVSLSWFGPHLTPPPYAYGFATSLTGALLTAFLILQAALIHLTLLPPRSLRPKTA